MHIGCYNVNPDGATFAVTKLSTRGSFSVLSSKIARRITRNGKRIYFSVPKVYIYRLQKKISTFLKLLCKDVVTCLQAKYNIPSIV